MRTFTLIIATFFLVQGAAICQDSIRIMPLGNSITLGNYLSETRYQYRIKTLSDFWESEYSSESMVKTFSEAELTNVAKSKTATQSSTIYEGFANLGIDGNTDGHFSNG